MKLIPPRFSGEKLITLLKGGVINFNPTVQVFNFFLQTIFTIHIETENEALYEDDFVKVRRSVHFSRFSQVTPRRLCRLEVIPRFLSLLDPPGQELSKKSNQSEKYCLRVIL